MISEPPVSNFGRKLPAVTLEIHVVRSARRSNPRAWVPIFSAYAAAGETSRAMRLALLISATRRS